MGILNGGIRFRRYAVDGELPPDFRDLYEQSIQQLGFRDFEPEDTREQVMGWAPVDDLFGSELHLDRWLVESSINLTLRIDTKRIPSRFLKQECRKLEAEWKLKAGREDLTRAEREEIVEIVTRRLLERVIPSCQGIDVSWDLDRGDVLVWSTSERANEAFRTLFEKTFGRKLRPLFPYALALRLLGDDAPETLESITPTSFIPSVAR
ncbi:MAG: recombination-associated protein RdgC [Deltaproteobacteria bacterium]|nr:recombination-associated protein RdgC [Deltaproteobacteria bacterium]